MKYRRSKDYYWIFVFVLLITIGFLGNVFGNRLMSVPQVEKLRNNYEEVFKTHIPVFSSIALAKVQGVEARLMLEESEDIDFPISLDNYLFLGTKKGNRQLLIRLYNTITKKQLMEKRLILKENGVGEAIKLSPGKSSLFNLKITKKDDSYIKVNGIGMTLSAYIINVY